MKKVPITGPIPFWRNKRIIPILLQVIFTVLVLTAGLTLISNALSGLKQIGITPGFSFLQNSASFAIQETTLLDYSPSDSYGKALLVGLLNTVRVAVFGILLASIIGVVIGVARLSPNWLMSKLAALYTEIFRNTPLLVQIFIWYFAVLLPLPRIEEALKLGPVYFSNRGIAIPWFQAQSGTWIWIIFLLIGSGVAVLLWKVMLKRQLENGMRTYPFVWAAGALFAASLLALFITQAAPVMISLPSIAGKTFTGGYTVSEGFSAILIGLVIYTSTFIAEIVRAGILGVPKGQIEAANALGLKSSTSLRLVIFPQAIRIIIPPLTSQYLNLIKNSSLAVAVGYPEIVHVGGTILNQSGRAIEVVSIWMIVYLTFSLSTSLFMNFFNKKFQLVER